MADFNPQERVRKMVNAIKNEVIHIFMIYRRKKNKIKFWTTLLNSLR